MSSKEDEQPRAIILTVFIQSRVGPMTYGPGVDFSAGPVVNESQAPTHDKSAF